MATEEHELLVAVNVSVDGSQKMAGFEVSINGRFWVSTEARKGDNADAAHPRAPVPKSLLIPTRERTQRLKA